jgi:hypothetical protein
MIQDILEAQQFIQMDIHASKTPKIQVLSQIYAEKMRVLLLEYNMYKKARKDEEIVNLIKEVPEKAYDLEKDEHVEAVLNIQIAELEKPFDLDGFMI